MPRLHKVEQICARPINVPQETALLYGRLWQLENWLRQMIYLELRCLKENWQVFLPKQGRKEKDKRLIHMSTSQESPLAYLDLKQLWEVIQDVDLWDIFSIYFLPQDLLKGKLEEIYQIRHRVAHFRVPHRDDLQRVEQFMKDINNSFSRWYRLYVERMPLTDPDHPFFKETRRLKPLLSEYSEDGSRVLFELNIEWSMRPWIDISKYMHLPVAEAGFVYYLSIKSNRDKLDYPTVLDQIARFEPYLIHVILEGECRAITVSFPGFNSTHKSIVTDIVGMVVDGTTDKQRAMNEADNIAARYPEYVLPPSNPLAASQPSSSEDFFGVY